MSTGLQERENGELSLSLSWEIAHHSLYLSLQASPLSSSSLGALKLGWSTRNLTDLFPQARQGSACEMVHDNELA